jgi:lipopolysaccharide export LptBFGC system permease protein LptF
MRALALEAGEGWRAWLLPLSVDGMMVAASMALLARRRSGEPGGLLAWSALLVGAATSIAANVAAAQPTVTGRAVAAWPPVALALAYELFLRQIGRQSRDRKHR